MNQPLPNDRRSARKIIATQLDALFAMYRAKTGAKKYDRKIDEAARLLAKAFVPKQPEVIVVKTPVPVEPPKKAVPRKRTAAAPGKKAAPKKASAPKKVRD
jgi:hypothetical protein